MWIRNWIKEIFIEALREEKIKFSDLRPATHALHLKCNNCGRTDFDLPADEANWRCPLCSPKVTGKIIEKTWFGDKS